jgi:signal peptidase II
MSKWAVLIVVAGLVFAADQVTKFLAVEHLTWVFQVNRAQTLPERVRAFVSQRDVRDRGLARPGGAEVIPGFWSNRYAENTGAAFGLLANSDEKLRVPFFYLTSIGAAIFIIAYYRKLTDAQRYLQVTLAMVFGGAIGNAVDRALHGYVIDFIDWSYGNYHWPTFNVADSAISVGLVFLLLEALFVKKPKESTRVTAR